MSNTNQSKIIIFISLALVLFGAAAAWKFLKSEEPEVAPPKVEKIAKTPTKKIKRKPTVETYPEYEKELMPTEEEQKVIKEETRDKMKMVMQYGSDTNKILRDAVALQDAGDEQGANELIDYLLKIHPDFEIPEDLFNKE